MEFDESRLSSPSFFAENRAEAHSDHVAYGSRQEYELGDNSLRFSLNGLWKFHHSKNPGQIIPGFEKCDFDCSGWDDIPVPAHLQMEGYGVPQYANVQYPWDGREQAEIGKAPHIFNPVGCYVKEFTLPCEMAGKRIFVSFQGAESCIALWLNGDYIGFSSDSFTPSEFELTSHLHSGVNKLACRVYRWCSGSWVEDQDFMRFSGIFRDVYLYAVPRVHLADVKITTPIADDFRSASLDVDTSLWGEGKISLQLQWKGNVVCRCEKEGNQISFSMPIDNPHLWSAEKPNLYDLEMTILDSKGNVTEFVHESVGFRRFEISDGVMKLNGVRIVFKGVDRHDFCTEYGRAVTPEIIRRDLLTMKRNNINAIRTSHYPNHSALYHICDELGLYVIDENNMESHGVWDMVIKGWKDVSYTLPGDRMDWLPLLLDRVNSTFQRDKNHACILMWSCGNESSGGKVIQAMSDKFRSLDSTRLTHYEGAYRIPSFPEESDVVSTMYIPAAQIREYLSCHREKPYILCEYAHSMGNSTGALHKYAQLAYEEPLYQGGFIWDYLDQAVRTCDRYGKTRYGYGGDWGEHPNDGNFCGNGILYADGTESPKVQEVRWCYRNIESTCDSHKVTVTNRFMFTSTSEFDCVVTLSRDGRDIAKAPLDTNVAPGETASYPLPLAIPEIPGEYAVTVSFRQKDDTPWASRGHEIAFDQGIFTVEGKKDREEHFKPLRIVYGGLNFGVAGENFDVLFSYLTNGLVSYRYGGKEMLASTPMPNFWRAPTDNDRGNQMPVRYGQWKLASLYSSMAAPGEAKEPEIRENDDGTVSIRFHYPLPTVPSSCCDVTYTVNPSGRINVLQKCSLSEGLSEMPEFGMMMKMDCSYDHFRWYGMGPEECYIDRCHGAKLGIYQTTAAENVSHYLKPQECGNRTGVRWAEVTDYRGRGLLFSSTVPMDFSVLPYTPHEMESAMHEDELPPVHYTVIRAAKQQMGIGGDDSWGARTHDEYLIDTSKNLEFSFSFQGKI